MKLIPVLLSSPVFWVLVLIMAASVVQIIYDYYRNPFKHPRIKYGIDLSGRRQPSYEECIDEWLIHFKGHGRAVENHYYSRMKDWESENRDYLNYTWFWRKHKLRLLDDIRNEVYNRDYKIFEFVFYRSQTRYRQMNYRRASYRVKSVEYRMNLTLFDIMAIDDELEEIGYETTREKYYAKSQRRLMTRELRRRIIERDNYTCQICGKYMPDEVGLHVDHVIPIKRGGKSVESNLQVLCDKCNLRKGKRM